MLKWEQIEKGKPSESWRRKAMGLRLYLYTAMIARPLKIEKVVNSLLSFAGLDTQARSFFLHGQQRSWEKQFW